MKNTIQYGIGPEYLPKWGLKEALREIFQNFIDYDGEYEIETEPCDPGENGLLAVSISNSYIPDKLEFLRIGNSTKSGNSIGKHGEGLKMALLIFARNNYNITINTDKYCISPRFIDNPEIGKLFVIDYEEMDWDYKDFKINFYCDQDIYNEFVDDIILPKDIIFTNKIGSIVNREKGNIYSGGLFVSNLRNLSKAYDISPMWLPLDRDRATPSSFDVHYYASKIQDNYGEFTLEDLQFSDLAYISKIPLAIKEQITPIIVGKDIEFMANDEVIKNSSVSEHLKNDGFFKETIDKLKISLLKGLGLYDMLVEFQSKHVHGKEAIDDFKFILDHVKNKGDE